MRWLLPVAMMRDGQLEFLRALETLGWSQSKLAKRLSVHANSVSAWATGKTPVPGPVRAYLRIALKAKGLME